MKLIKGSHLQGHDWGGGKTRELYIFPENTSYKERNFSFRLSTATIDVEQSEFTPLSGIRRELMVTRNALTLHHLNQYNIQLHPFESDRFVGDWKTTSVGIASDFNLMMRGKTQGYLKHLHCENNGDYTIDTDCDMIGLYCVKGKFTFSGKTISDSDLLIFETSAKSITFSIIETADLIVVRLWLHN